MLRGSELYRFGNGWYLYKLRICMDKVSKVKVTAWRSNVNNTKLIVHFSFEYSALEPHILKTTNDRNKQISDSESRHLDDFISVKRDSICTSNIHAQSDTQKQVVLYTLVLP